MVAKTSNVILYGMYMDMHMSAWYFKLRVKFDYVGKITKYYRKLLGRGTTASELDI